jgi:hypothetical protein
MQEEFNDEQRATMKNIQSFLQAIFGGIMFLVFGTIADAFSIRTALGANIILDLTIMILYYRLFQKYKG